MAHFKMIGPYDHRTGGKRDKTVVILQLYSYVGLVRDRLIEKGYSFIERDIFSTFHGTEFEVRVPAGRGRQQHLNYLFEQVTDWRKS